jgi:hypothetical protein
MLKSISICLFVIVVFSCNNKPKGPDVSQIKADLKLERFEDDFFAIDSNNIMPGLNALQLKYPVFAPLFINNILGAGSDSNGVNTALIKSFLHLSDSIYLFARDKYKNFDGIKKELEQAFRYVKYYHPTYALPAITTLIGPPDVMAQQDNGEQSPVFIGPDRIGISLQFYLGKNYPMYQDDYFIRNVAPQYRSRRFEKEYITADVMKMVIDDIYPDKSKGKGLIEQMIEKGKQWYMLNLLLPEAADSVKTGYTNAQVNWCRENEGQIWNQLIRTEKLDGIDPETLQTYIGESPFTITMPEQSPGNIGPWIGLQIINKYVSKNSKLTPQQVMNTPARTILDEAKYKPK